MSTRLIVASTSTSGECDLFLCEAHNLVASLGEMAGMGAEGFEDITADPRRAQALIEHLEENDFYVDPKVKAWVQSRLAV